MKLCLKNFGMPVLVHLSVFHVKVNEFITFHKVTWNRFYIFLCYLIYSLNCNFVFVECIN